jgi:hypothetical protein
LTDDHVNRFQRNLGKGVRLMKESQALYESHIAQLEADNALLRERIERLQMVSRWAVSGLGGDSQECRDILQPGDLDAAGAMER